MESHYPRIFYVICQFIITVTFAECTATSLIPKVLIVSRKEKSLRSEPEYYLFNKKRSHSLDELYFGDHKHYVDDSKRNSHKKATLNTNNVIQKSMNRESHSSNFSNDSFSENVSHFSSNLTSKKISEMERHLVKRKHIKKRNSAGELDFEGIVNSSIFMFPNWTILGNNTTNNGSNNYNSSSSAPKFRFHTVVKGLILFGLGFAALIGNVATYVSIKRLGRHQSSTVYLLLIHLSVADLLVTWFCIVGEALWTFSVEWLGSDSMCKLFKFLQMFALYLSTFTIIVIGFDRMFAVRYPMRRVNARNLVQKSIFSAWILSCILSLPQIAVFRVVKGPFEEEFYQCVTYGFYTAAWQEQLYTSISLLFMFLIPLISLIATYTTTFLTIASKKRVFGDSPNLFEDARYKILRRAKVKSLWITVVIVTTFMVCWTPYYISMIITVFLEPDEQLGEDLNDAIFFFGSSTAVLNPIIYGAFHLKRKNERPSSTNSSRYELTFVFSTLRRMRDSLARSSSSRQGSRKRQPPIENIT